MVPVIGMAQRQRLPYPQALSPALLNNDPGAFLPGDLQRPVGRIAVDHDRYRIIAPAAERIERDVVDDPAYAVLFIQRRQHHDYLGPRQSPSLQLL